MTDPDLKLVKVDNWGIYFLQRLKHFFNRTDYCDLTLQFQDNAQLKVHRLVLSACTEYFELLERTCEMYEDCLVMPDDLQADVVVPIVNFMYTGQLEFKMDLLERLYQTSQIMSMPVLTKLLEAHRCQALVMPLQNKQMAPQRLQPMGHSSVKRSYTKNKDKSKQMSVGTASSNSLGKRSYPKAFGNAIPPVKEAKKAAIIQSKELNTNNGLASSSYYSSINQPSSVSAKKVTLPDPRPTRYELPEELDTDNIFDSSFTNISYTSQPLMVHPETTKHYKPKKSGIFIEPSGSRKSASRTSIVDIVECKKVGRSENIFEDDEMITENDMYLSKEPQVSNQLFDQIVEENAAPRVVIETKDSEQAANIDHAKIISEVLKKYPHLVKSNKNIKLKILNPKATPTPSISKARPKKIKSDAFYDQSKYKTEAEPFTYESEVLDSKEAARLIALGAENVSGPWICLICGTPGRALHFTTYYNFRRHLVDVHKEKPVANMCEHCGLKSHKRNYLLHHLLTKHGIEPPPSHHFPKCNLCNYVALTESFLIKHKMSHQELKNFRCNVCMNSFSTSNELLSHIRKTGHKYCADRKINLQCVYCQKVFLREGNLYAHLKTYHKLSAKNDGIIDDSDEEKPREDTLPKPIIKNEPTVKTEYDEYVETQYQVTPDGNIVVITTRKNQSAPAPVPMSEPASVQLTPSKQKILNTNFGQTDAEVRPLPIKDIGASKSNELNEDIVVIDNNEYIMRDNQLILRQKTNDFVATETMSNEADETATSTAPMDYPQYQDTVNQNLEEQSMNVNKAAEMNQIQIVVSNEEEYKAFMNSNHSIIFDNSDANKTLTVLSAPQTAALNTASIDLGNNQSNDMMIIPDNYPLNVTESLPADNSNYVVVYSHNVDEQNKQYQLISSQDIGPQFVQSSAIITQNYGTITTSTPMVNAQVIETQVAQDWQGNIQDSRNVQVTSVGDVSMQQLQEMTIIEHSDITSVADANITLNDLPEVTLTSIQKEVPHQVVETAETQNESLQDVHEISSPSRDDVQNVIDATPMTVIIPAEDSAQPICPANESPNLGDATYVQQEIENNETQEYSETYTETDVPKDQSSEVPAIIGETTQNVDVRDASQIEEMDTEETGVQEAEHDATDITETVVIAEVPEQEEATEVTEHAKVADITEHDNAAEDTEPQILAADVNNENEVHISDPNNENKETECIEPDNCQREELENTGSEQTVLKLDNEKIPEEVKEKIQSLASEWSEDEEDIGNQGQVETKEQIAQEPNEDKQLENNITAEPELAEPENTQHETDMPNEESPEAETVEAISPDVNSLPEQSVLQSSTAVPQENISSLLNDWEEHDSQEGNESADGTADTGHVAKASEENLPPVNESGLEETKKDDKIQSLVNDWDEDEEECKN